MAYFRPLCSSDQINGFCNVSWANLLSLEASDFMIKQPVWGIIPNGVQATGIFISTRSTECNGRQTQKVTRVVSEIRSGAVPVPMPSSSVDHHFHRVSKPNHADSRPRSHSYAGHDAAEKPLGPSDCRICCIADAMVGLSPGCLLEFRGSISTRTTCRPSVAYHYMDLG